MTITLSSCGALSDADLLATVKQLAARERHATAQLVASLVELDTRRLYLGEGCSSLFTYCTQVLHLSEHAAYGRIEAARAARRFPVILDRLADGSLTLTAVCLLAPHLTADNHVETLGAAAHKSKRDVEHLVAALHPQPTPATSIRKLPSSPRPATPPLQADVRTHAAEHLASDASASPSVPPAAATRRPAIVVPVAPEQYKVQIAVGAETVAKLRKAERLMRHTIPTGDLAAILDRALTMLIAHLERTKTAAVMHPRVTPGRPVAPGSRHIPAAVRRAVWARDEGRCAFAGTTGRCTETAFLEFHHIVPYAAGGEATVETIALRCRAHNLYEAELDFGPRPQHARAAREGPVPAPPLLRESRERFGSAHAPVRRNSSEFRIASAGGQHPHIPSTNSVRTELTWPDRERAPMRASHGARSCDGRGLVLRCGSIVATRAASSYAIGPWVASRSLTGESVILATTGGMARLPHTHPLA